MSEYISREAFLAEQRHLYCENCARRKNGKGKFVYDIGDAPCRACDIMDVLDAVEDFPAADVRPVVTGRWIKVPVLAPFEQDDFRCSECDSWPWWCGVTEEILPNFCPNCGAKMGGEDE